MGLAKAMIYHCKGNSLEKMLLLQDNDYLVSAIDDMTAKHIEWLRDTVGSDRLWLDSGGFSLFRKESKLGKDSPEFKKECESVRKKFLRLLQVGGFKMCFELDNEYFRKDDDLLSPKNYLRDEVKAITGYYPVPVFKIHQGFQYWKDLCDSPLYPILSIGGLAQGRQWHLYREELSRMMKYARDNGKYVHLLGCSNVETTRYVMPDSVDHSIYRFAINIARARENYVRKVREGIITPPPEVYESAGEDLSGRIPLKYLGQDMVVFAFADARARQFLYEKQNEDVIE